MFSATASVKAVGGLGWMTCPTQVNCRRHRNVEEPKTLTGSSQKVRSRMLHLRYGAHGHKDCRCRGRD